MHNPDERPMSVNLSYRIDAAIEAGIGEGQSENLRRHKRMKRRIVGVAAACLLLLSCLFTIRVSPVFAALVREIPGFEKFVDLLHNSSSDKGIQLALDNDFVQPVGVSDEHDGMKFTVQGIIADDSRMVVFYEMRFPGKDHAVELDAPRLTDTSGKPLPGMSSYNSPYEAKQDIRKTGVQRGMVDIQLSQGTSLPGEVRLKMKFKRVGLPNKTDTAVQANANVADSPTARPVDEGGPIFEVNIPIDRAKFAGMRHEYPLGQTIEAEGQRITFSKAVVSPLSVSLFMEYGEGNAKQIFGAQDIRLVDEQGTVWRNTWASGGSEHPVYHFESPYFKEPKSLMVEGSAFTALVKNNRLVKVDTEKRLLLQTPDNKLRLHDIIKTARYTKLDFLFNGYDSADKRMHGSLDSEFTDGAGSRIKMADLQEEVIGASFDTSKPGQMHLMYYIDNKAYTQPLTFTILDYPSYIRQPYKIRIK